MNRAEKVQAVAQLGERFGRAAITIATDYRGLNVAEITDLRRRVRAADGEFVVAKNTLARRAVRDTDAAAIEPLLVGPTALAFGFSDVVAVAKAIHEFAKEHEALEIKGAVFDGQALSPAEVAKLAAMPSRDELRAKLLALMTTPATMFVRLLSTPAQQLAQVLAARQRQLEEQG
ncbi:MAG: 50S ribosomal protein L10 [Candidatus Dadabacteria bacterium]|nr:MAG: 50S ribosomal protein L10 [Candidatus Dadabacteria bacterium]